MLLFFFFYIFTKSRFPSLFFPDASKMKSSFKCWILTFVYRIFERPLLLLEDTFLCQTDCSSQMGRFGLWWQVTLTDYKHSLLFSFMLILRSHYMLTLSWTWFIKWFPQVTLMSSEALLFFLFFVHFHPLSITFFILPEHSLFHFYGQKRCNWTIC